MRHIRSTVLYLLVLVAAWTAPCGAGVIINGDFSEFDSSTGLPTGWDHFDHGGEFTPPDYIDDGVDQLVRFHENDQLEQLFDLPGNALTLSFEYRFVQIGDGVSGVTPDSFQATLYDDNFDPLLGDPFGFFTIDHAGTYFDSTYVALTALADEWQRVTLDVSSLAPMTDLLLEFLVNGFDDGRTTTVDVDNVAVGVASVTSVIPEPTSAAIFLGLGICCWINRRRFAGRAGLCRG